MVVGWEAWTAVTLVVWEKVTTTPDVGTKMRSR